MKPGTYLHAAVLYFAACGCGPSHSGGDIRAMKEALLREVPPGTAPVDAEARMRKLGYRVSTSTNGTFSEEGEVHYGITFLYCDCSEFGGVPVERRWQVAVVYGPDGVSDILVAASLTGP